MSVTGVGTPLLCTFAVPAASCQRLARTAQLSTSTQLGDSRCSEPLGGLSWASDTLHSSLLSWWFFLSALPSRGMGRNRLCLSVRETKEIDKLNATLERSKPWSNCIQKDAPSHLSPFSASMKSHSTQPTGHFSKFLDVILSERPCSGGPLEAVALW